MTVFTVIVLGATGGVRENNLSCYLVGANPLEGFVALDAGSLLSGIEWAYQKKNLSEIPLEDAVLTPIGKFFQQYIKAYLISHVHLDHIYGLVINSQTDSPKAILGLDSTIDFLRDHIFNGVIWPNYGSEGTNPIGRYRYTRLSLNQSVAIPGLSLTVEPFLLSHPGNYPSTAFLLFSEGHALLYFGDTASDLFEKTKRMRLVWERVAPLLKKGLLRGIFLECSYPNEHPKTVNYGHLTPDLMLEELGHLSTLAGTSLKGLSVIVTHRKDTLRQGEDQKETILHQLKEKDPFGVRWIAPIQGERILL